MRQQQNKINIIGRTEGDITGVRERQRQTGFKETEKNRKQTK